MAQDHYAVLGVSRQATPEELRNAYRAIARVAHPDRSQDPKSQDMFKRATEAYKILSDPEKRKAYDTGFNPVTSVQDLFSRHAAGRNVLDIMLPSAPAVPQRGVDVAQIVPILPDMLERGGTITVKINAPDGTVQDVRLTLPEQAKSRTWCRLRQLGGIGRNFASHGDLWIMIALTTAGK